MRMLALFSVLCLSADDVAALLPSFAPLWKNEELPAFPYQYKTYGRRPGIGIQVYNSRPQEKFLLAMVKCYGAKFNKCIATCAAGWESLGGALFVLKSQLYSQDSTCLDCHAASGGGFSMVSYGHFCIK